MKKLLPTILLSTLIILYTLNLNAQSQIGQDIAGETFSNNSGWSVSMGDAITVAIGAPGNSANSGHVRVFEFNGTSWVQKGADIDAEATADRCGWSVSMPNANTLGIGANFNDGNGTQAGHVRIYTWSGTAWVQKGSDIDGEAAGDESGGAISMPDVNTIAIGASQNNGTGFGSGHVRVYRWNGTNWVQKGGDLNGEAINDKAGTSVSMGSPNTVAIGAPFNDGNGLDAGHVRVYDWNGTAWVQKGVDIEGETANDRSGNSVSMPDANTLAIGAILNDGTAANAGHVRIYSWNGSAWVQKGSDIDGEAAGDEFGVSVSMADQNTIAIGGSFNDGRATDAGHTRIYKWNGTNWVQKLSDIDGEAADDRSGYSVSMADDNTIAIGAWLNDDNGSNSGHVRVYSLCSNSSATINATTCFSYTSPSGRYTFTSSGTYNDTIFGSGGCDSIYTINLTINTVDTAVIRNHTTLTANITGATYQWLNCDSNYMSISGETTRNFTATENGNYAVEITENGCIDTSFCVSIFYVGIDENELDANLKVYPNPTKNKVFVELGQSQEQLTVIVRNAVGEEVKRELLNAVENFELELQGKSGIYWIELIAEDGKKASMKVVKD